MFSFLVFLLRGPFGTDFDTDFGLISGDFDWFWVVSRWFWVVWGGFWGTDFRVVLGCWFRDGLVVLESCWSAQSLCLCSESRLCKFVVFVVMFLWIWLNRSDATPVDELWVSVWFCCFAESCWSAQMLRLSMFYELRVMLSCFWLKCEIAQTPSLSMNYEFRVVF